jgi:hypothetical protein
MPGMVRSSRSTCGRGRPARAVLAGQHQDVFLVGAAEADLDWTPGKASRLRATALDGLLGDAAALLARRQVDGQRRLAHLGARAA